jgi:hypothetical protein
VTEYLNKSFSVYSGTGETYRDNWDRIFGKKKERPEPPKEPEPEPECNWLDTCSDWEHDQTCPVYGCGAGGSIAPESYDPQR